MPYTRSAMARMSVTGPFRFIESQINCPLSTCACLFNIVMLTRDADVGYGHLVAFRFCGLSQSLNLGSLHPSIIPVVESFFQVCRGGNIGNQSSRANISVGCRLGSKGSSPVKGNMPANRPNTSDQTQHRILFSHS